MKKIVFIILVFYTSGIHAQFKRPFFNTISVENGLPEALVLASLQDKLGYLWLGTQNGLVRYDGYSTKLYPLPNADGKPVNFVSVDNIFEDKLGVLWVGIFHEGYYIFDRQKDVFKRAASANTTINETQVSSFTKFIYDKRNDIGWSIGFDRTTASWIVQSRNFLNGTVDVFNAKNKGRFWIPAGKDCADIMLDSSGNTWLATNALLSKYDTASKSFKPYFQLPEPMNKIMFNYITQDPVNKHILWISTILLDSSIDANKVKVIQLNTISKAYKTYDHIASDPFSVAGTCTDVYIDSRKRMFFYTDHGISIYNRESENFTNYFLTVPGMPAETSIPISTIAADKEGNLWIGGEFSGLFFLNTTTAATTFYTHTDETGSLPNFGNINKLFFDRAGVLWVSMPFSGIAWLDPQRSFFNPVKIDPPVNETDKNPGTILCAITGMHNDSTFFVSNNASIFSWNHTSNDFKNITPGEGKQPVSIGATITDKEGLIWMASFGSGLYCYNPVSKTTINYRNDPKDSTSIGSNNIFRMEEDNEGNLWIGTSGNGLNSFNKKTGKFTRYPFINNSGATKANNVLDDSRALSLLCDKEGTLWIGTNLGSLNRYDTKKAKFFSYMDYKEGFSCIISLYEDSHNRLWAGSYLTGLFLVNKDSGFLKHYTEKDGLSSNDIRGITEDKNGNIWLSTSHGLSRLNPGNDQITNYTTINGLPVVQTAGIYKDSQGLFYVPIKNGVIPFDPANMAENKVPPEVIIESVKYHAEASNKDSILFTEELQQLSLKYNENRISFQYVALHFTNASLNQYAYQLEGYDKDWIAAGTERTVTYTNLSPGTYTFKVKAANSDGVWNETGARFTFSILPPWWKTWWAYTLYALIFLGVLRIFSKWRERNLRSEKEKLEIKVEERTNSLKSTLDNLKSTQNQLIQSEKMASLGELTAGIAHEIQNPLNFVNNFSEVNKELLIEMKDEIDKGNMTEAKAIANDVIENEEKINHHGKRADSIVKGMLQHSRISNGQKEPTDINALLDEYLRLSYHGIRAKDKSFNATLKTDFDESIGKINIIPQDIGRVILNLITNAFYAVGEKKKQSTITYEPIVSVSTKSFSPPSGGRGVSINIADNGNGIPPNILDKIFQPFFTTKPTGLGTGLGLSLSYDIVKAHGGELKVETKEGKGATFIIQLPV